VTVKGPAHVEAMLRPSVCFAEELETLSLTVVPPARHELGG